MPDSPDSPAAVAGREKFNVVGPEGSILLLLGSTGSSAVVCTLWTPKAAFARFDKETYFALGNLYSIDGINLLIRNLLLNPHCRTLVVTGHDLSGSGEALLAFFSGRKGDYEPDEGLPAGAIGLVRANVSAIDMRKKPLSEVEAFLKGLAGKKGAAPPYAEPKSYPIPPRKLDPTLDSEEAGYFIRHKTIANAWLEALSLVDKFGAVKRTEYGNKMREIFNLVAVINEDDGSLAEFFPFTAKDLEAYLPSILTPERPAAISYTYGSRLFSREDRMNADQVTLAIEHLKRTPHTRRAVAFTWRVSEDSGSEHPPCLTQIVWGIREGRLFQTVVFRSHDIFSGWPMNLLALRKLQQNVAKEVGVKTGALTCVSNSAHVYEDKFGKMREILNKYYHHHHHHRPSPALIIDPRGSFVICLKREAGEVFVDHFSTAHKKTGYFFRGREAKEIISNILNENLVSRLDHAYYLGKELERAFRALREGKPYVQDENSCP